MTEITPKFEVFFNDLKNLDIGNFLKSREFKLFMSERGRYEEWKHFYERVRSSRTYMSLGTDHEAGDAINTFAIYINAIESNIELEDFITQIIERFILSNKTKKGFSDLCESMRIAKFKDSNIAIIKKSIEIQEKKNLPVNLPVIAREKDIKVNQLINKKDIFIVHGHDEEAKVKTARFIEKLGLTPIILHEQASQGKTIIEKIEEYSNVGFGIVLYTPCDIGGKKTNQELLKNRARQNVVFEHGFLIGKIGRKNVCALVKGEIEKPNDISGVVYVDMDNSDAWQLIVAKEMRSSGFSIDMNKL